MNVLKRFTGFILVVVMMVGLSGCGISDERLSEINNQLTAHEIVKSDWVKAESLGFEGDMIPEGSNNVDVYKDAEGNLYVVNIYEDMATQDLNQLKDKQNQSIYIVKVLSNLDEVNKKVTTITEYADGDNNPVVDSDGSSLNHTDVNESVVALQTEDTEITSYKLVRTSPSSWMGDVTYTVEIVKN